MTAPRRPADVPGLDVSTALVEQYVQHELHLDDRGRIQSWHQLGPEDLVRDGLAVLAIGEAIAQRVTQGRWCWVVQVLRSGGPVGDVAAAMDVEPDEVRAGLRSWVDGQQQLYRDTGIGLTPAEGDAVRGLVEEVATCLP